MMQRTAASLLLFACCVGACTGNILDSGDNGELPGSESPKRTGPGENPPVCADGVCVGTSALQRMTRSQYVNSVRALLGPDTKVDVRTLPPDHSAAGIFASNESQNPSVDDIARYSTAADVAAASALLAAIVPCDVATGTKACFQSFVDRIGARAYRHALTVEERTAYLDAYDWARSKGDTFETTVRFAIAVMLQSPSFLYLVEQASDAGPRRLSSVELATRLSFFLLREAPSEELLARAAGGGLDTVEGIDREAAAMLADPKLDRALRDFHRQWLGINDVAATTPSGDFTSTIARDMLAETDRFVVHVFREADGKQQTLLGAPYSMLNANLAAYYGVPAPSAPFAKTTIPGRAGLLTHGSVLTAQSTSSYTAPIFRGIFVRTRVLCDTLGGRPDDVDDAIAKKEATIPALISDRERLTLLTGQSPCSSCHDKTNEIGFAFSNFDAVGKSRLKDYAGFPIDTSSRLTSGGDSEYATDVDGSYPAAEPMLRALAGSSTVASCLSLQWMRYALGRDADGDTTSLTPALARYRATGLDLRELVRAIVRTDAFRHRAAPKLTAP
jgi:hypothetical protein